MHRAERRQTGSAERALDNIAPLLGILLVAVMFAGITRSDRKRYNPAPSFFTRALECLHPIFIGFRFR
jgi:hypothetical protein